MDRVWYHNSQRGETIARVNDHGTLWGRAERVSREVAEIDPTREACGYIDRGRLVVCHNVAPGAGKFALTTDDAWALWMCLDADELGGVWHSHPLGHREPSEADWVGHPRGVPLYIVVLLNSYETEVLRYDDADRPLLPESVGPTA